MENRLIKTKLKKGQRKAEGLRAGVKDPLAAILDPKNRDFDAFAKGILRWQRGMGAVRGLGGKGTGRMADFMAFEEHKKMFLKKYAASGEWSNKATKKAVRRKGSDAFKQALGGDKMDLIYGHLSENIRPSLGHDQNRFTPPEKYTDTKGENVQLVESYIKSGVLDNALAKLDPWERGSLIPENMDMWATPYISLLYPKTQVRTSGYASEGIPGR